jgi:hypothetical protein
VAALSSTGQNRPITAPPAASIGDENAITRSRLLAEKERAMPERRRFKQTETLERRFLDEGRKVSQTSSERTARHRS